MPSIEAGAGEVLPACRARDKRGERPREESGEKAVSRAIVGLGVVLIHR